MTRELRDLVRWLVTGRSLPETYYVHAIELEELRADLTGLVRAISWGLVLIAAGVAAGYVAGRWS